MRTILLFSIGLLLSVHINAQTWYKQVIRDEIAISFPVAPEHKTLDNKGKEAYLLDFDGCGFMVGVIPDAIDDYDSYLMLADSEKTTKALRTLESIAMGKVNSKNQHLISMKSFKSRKGVGLDVEYTTLEPSDLNSRKRFSTLLLVKNTAYIFDCWYLDDKDHDVEREKFFKSIQLKD